MYLPKYHNFSWNDLDLKNTLTWLSGCLVFCDKCWLSSYWCLLFGCSLKIAPCIMVLTVGWWCSHAWVSKVGEHTHFYISSSISNWHTVGFCWSLRKQNVWRCSKTYHAIVCTVHGTFPYKKKLKKAKGKVKKNKNHKTSDFVWSFETLPLPMATSDNFWFFFLLYQGLQSHVVSMREEEQYCSLW